MDIEIAAGLLLVIALVMVLLIGINREGSDQKSANVQMGIREPLPPLSSAGAEDEHSHFYKQVHGVTFKNDDGSSRQQIIKSCSVGEELQLIPEPDNPYDSEAVKVCRKNGEQLGYLPSGHRMSEDGQLIADYRVTIEEIYPLEEKPRSKGCKLRIGVLKPEAC